MPKTTGHQTSIVFRPDLWRRIETAAAKRRQSTSEYVRQAVFTRLSQDDMYFYVRLEGGSYWPPLTETGFDDRHNADIAAAKRGGVVVRKLQEKRDEPGT